MLREGNEDDVRHFVRVDELVDLWDEMVLPDYVRAAWDRWFVTHGDAIRCERSTNDLDCFTPAPTDVPVLRHALEIAFAEAGLTVTIVRDTETFVRLAVGDGITDTLIDLTWDARMRPAVSSDLGPVLDQEELAADKVLA